MKLKKLEKVKRRKLKIALASGAVALVVALAVAFASPIVHGVVVVALSLAVEHTAIGLIGQ